MRAFLSVGHADPPGAEDDDPGAVAGKVREDEMAWRVVNACALALKVADPDLVPHATLVTRIAWVNQWSQPGDVAVEVHLNSGPPDAYGCEAYYASARGRQLAAELHAGLAKIGRSPRGVKPDTQSHRGRLGWCRQTLPWAALVEVAFLTNEAERMWLVSGGAEQAGRALAVALDKVP